jgi:Uma2 family endonuclease
MTAMRKPRKFTPEEYLRLEEVAEYKSEYCNGEIFAMAGANHHHNFVFANLFIAVGKRLEGKRCRPLGPDQRLRVLASGLYTYPDMQIVCDRANYDPRSSTTLINPTVIFEIISESTEDYDCGTKLGFYKDVESAREIVYVWPDEPRIEVHIRTPDGQWGMLTYRDLASDFTIASVKLTIPLAEIYREPVYKEPE